MDVLTAATPAFAVGCDGSGPLQTKLATPIALHKGPIVRLKHATGAYLGSRSARIGLVGLRVELGFSRTTRSPLAAGVKRCCEGTSGALGWSSHYGDGTTKK